MYRKSCFLPTYCEHTENSQIKHKKLHAPLDEMGKGWYNTVLYKSRE